MKKSRKMVRKNVWRSVIYASYMSLEPDNSTCIVTELPPIEAFGPLNMDETFKKLYDAYGTLPFTDISVDTVKTTYEMPLDEFLEHAFIKKEVATEQTQQEGNK